MRVVHFIVFSALFVATFSQRSPYAGRQPIGYPAIETTVDPLGNRFGGPTEPLPVEALGDRELVNRLAKLPVDQQPFWYLNWKALEQQRKNQETYQPKPNPFLDNGTPDQNSPQNQAQNQVQNNQWNTQQNGQMRRQSNRFRKQ